MVQVGGPRRHRPRLVAGRAPGLRGLDDLRLGGRDPYSGAAACAHAHDPPRRRPRSGRPTGRGTRCGVPPRQRHHSLFRLRRAGCFDGFELALRGAPVAAVRFGHRRHGTVLPWPRQLPRRFEAVRIGIWPSRPMQSETAAARGNGAAGRASSSAAIARSRGLCASQARSVRSVRSNSAAACGRAHGLVCRGGQLRRCGVPGWGAAGALGFFCLRASWRAGAARAWPNDESASQVPCKPSCHLVCQRNCPLMIRPSTQVGVFFCICLARWGSGQQLSGESL